MTGTVKTFLQEKNYGFIYGDDGKDYFFRTNWLKDQTEVKKIAEECRVEFDPQATPRGYRANRVCTVGVFDTPCYVVPDTCLTSAEDKIKGWEIMEMGEWEVHGSSKNSPDSAKSDLIKSAEAVGANGIIHVNYYKTTGSEGNYHYSIHNFVGRVVTIAKRNAKGERKKEDLVSLNETARAVKAKLDDRNEADSAKKARAVGIWRWITGIFSFGLTILLFVTDPGWFESAGGAILFIFAPFGISMFVSKRKAPTHGLWLVKLSPPEQSDQKGR
jgi:cold shock CspA family protein/uncharacterized protein YbjQ (UPF0145 family)